MACPSSGEITMKGIHQELNVNDYSNAVFDNNQIKMSHLHDGTEGTINTAGNPSSNRPDGSAPHEMSEFYSYDHDAVKSDIRLKTNIQLLGHSDLNIPIYSFNFKDNQKVTYRGVMAQDLIKMGYDDSVVMGDDGFYSVNYNDIDVDFKVL